MVDKPDAMVPVVYQLMPLDPATSGKTLAWLAFGGAAGGAVLWLFGSRFSRSLVTLIAVAVGASIGLHIPRWFTLPIGSWATAVGGALVMGIAGYTLHAMWAGIALASVLASWVLVGTWVGYGLPMDWVLPERGEGVLWWQYATQVWGALPLEMKRVGPMMAGLGAVGGLVLGVIWSRMAVIVLHSVVGVTLMAGLGLIGMELGRPTMLRMVPTTQAGQVGTLIGLVLFGVLVQWRLASTKKVAAEPAAEG